MSNACPYSTTRGLSRRRRTYGGAGDRFHPFAVDADHERAGPRLALPPVRPEANIGAGDDRSGRRIGAELARLGGRDRADQNARCNPQDHEQGSTAKLHLVHLRRLDGRPRPSVLLRSAALQGCPRSFGRPTGLRYRVAIVALGKSDFVSRRISRTARRSSADARPRSLRRSGRVSVAIILWYTPSRTSGRSASNAGE